MSHGQGGGDKGPRPGIRRAKKPRANGSWGRGECGVVFGAEGEPCSTCNRAEVHEIDQRLRADCHRPSRDQTHVSPRYHLPRATQYLDDTKERGVALSTERREGYRPATDCLCTTSDCVAQTTMRDEDKRKRPKRVLRSVCRGFYCSCSPRASSWVTQSQRPSASSTLGGVRGGERAPLTARGHGSQRPAPCASHAAACCFKGMEKVTADTHRELKRRGSRRTDILPQRTAGHGR